MTIKKQIYAITAVFSICTTGCGQSERKVELSDVIKQAEGVSVAAEHSITADQLKGYAVWCSTLARATVKAANDYHDNATQDAFNRGWLLGFSSGS